MFYEPEKNDHGLPFNPFKALVIPRPIGWISTLGRDGRINLAPYSYFNACSTDPPVVLFGADPRPHPLKDSQRNVEETGEFVANLATFELREAMNLTSAHVAEDEMALAGLTAAPAVKVRAPRVAESPVHLECRYLQTVPLPPDRTGRAAALVLGQVVGIHIRDDVIENGRVAYDRIRPIARLGYMDYAVVDTVFSMERPG